MIIGQDPYHEPGQAHGLSFSVKPGVTIPPSLVNIYQELHDDLGCKIPNNGYLEKWADQGVLMLNAVLTVQAHRAGSHQGKGWEHFTDAAIRILNVADMGKKHAALMEKAVDPQIEMQKIEAPEEKTEPPSGMSNETRKRLDEMYEKFGVKK